ncbi:MAG: T9SS type A sorting domain-containing protein [Ignavibacteriales bacterium]|nr:T9SS type A sorting domain-containing protein [Ignavibacteriales bacterium]
MKRLLFIVLAVFFAINIHAAERKTIKRFNSLTKTWITTPLVTVYDIQYVLPESLAIAESLPIDNTSRWTSQVARRVATPTLDDDTVTVVALVVVPTNVITYTARGKTLLLYDTTTNIQEWGGLLARSENADSAAMLAAGYFALEQGDVILLTGVVQEFPTSALYSATQLKPIPGFEITPLGKKALPKPIKKNVSDFYTGLYPGQVKFTSGEKYEGMLVELTDLICDTRLNTSRGTITMVDAAGNQISDYDCSRYFTFGSLTDHPFGPDPVWTATYPTVGQRVDTIRGFITTASGTEGYRGYRISPLFYGDVVLGISLPTVTYHRRYPVAVTSNDSVRIQAIVRYNQGGFGIRRAVMLKSINNGPWQADTMSLIGADSTYESLIIDAEGNPLVAGTEVKYFIKGIDTVGNEQILANGDYRYATDTSKGFFFYKVIDGPMKIKDVQYTPYANGRSPYTGGQVTVTGTITADSTDLMKIAHSDWGTSCWYVQSGNQPWSGIWVAGTDSVMRGYMKGDSITFKGWVSEYTTQNSFVTRLTSISDITLIGSGKKVPDPVYLTTSTFQTGSPTAEQYEGMLVMFKNLTVSNTGQYYSDPTLYEVDDGSGPIYVNTDGLNSYSISAMDTSTGKTRILYKGDKIDSLIGIIYCSANRWDIDPRTDADFRGVGDTYSFPAGWNIVSIPKTQEPSANYAISNLFPGYSGNAFYYEGNYKSTSQLDIRKAYWMKFPSAKTVRQIGKARTLDTVAVVTGWNMIGSLSSTVLAADFEALPPTNVLSSFFRFEGGYQISDTIKPTFGYWVKASEEGTIVMKEGTGLSKFNPTVPLVADFNSITISDKNGNKQILYIGEDAERKLDLSRFELPPAAIEVSSFDARFANGGIVATYPKNITEPVEYPININSDNAPLSISWNITDGSGKLFVLADYNNGKTLKTKELVGSGSMLFTKSGSSKLNVKVINGGSLPKVFSLGENYPNPFNPSTRLQVSMPKLARLQVAVYNLLGQKVATLVDEVREAGYHTVEWNASSVASGVYFIRMNADAFSSVRKVMLMK